MLRRALSYQLILAVAVGPLLCCCSAGKTLAGSTSMPSGSVAPPARVPTERVSHSCCSQKHPPAEADSDQKSAPAKPGQPTGKCPCKDGTDKPQMTPAESTQSDLATLFRALAFDAVVPFASLVANEIVSEVACLDAGWRLGHTPSPTDELLYAHHNLRC